MPVADGLRDIINKVGTEFEFGGGTGKLASEAKSQPYWINARFPHDTIVTGPGDLIVIAETRYLVVSFVKDMFENTLVQHLSILLVCNMVFSLQRETGSRDGNYGLEVTWPDVMADCFGARLDMAGQRLAEERIGDLKLESDMVYVPAAYDCRIGDRLVSSSGRKYRVEGIKDDQFPGIFVLETGEDNR